MVVSNPGQMGKYAIIAIFVLVLVGCTLAEKAKQSDQTLSVATTGPLEPVTQGAAARVPYHYTGKYCTDCHERPAVAGGAQFLKYNGDFNKLCSKCHLEGPGSYIHPVDILPSSSARIRIPKDFPLQNGKLTCLTCHDIYKQCQKSTLDKNSLRGAPYQNRAAICLQCHVVEDYRRPDIHRQVDAEGNVMTETCLYCHVEKPDEKQARFDGTQLIGNLETLCQRCHKIRGKHGGDANHMVKPSPQRLATMKEMENKFNIILPLDADGRITCVTCHNPHAKGVIPSEGPASKGADSKYRHRLPGRLCTKCHRM